mmetsp:Transcript_53458/g.143039  ORF Transcript_53458/g.143039 Transcript_53458/m.143039 type:complete len:122 (-) Transcript_53458:1271-1636(-)
MSPVCDLRAPPIRDWYLEVKVLRGKYACLPAGVTGEALRPVLLGANPLLARTGGPVVLDTRFGETLLVPTMLLLGLLRVCGAFALGRAPRPVAPPMEVLMLFPGVSGFLKPSDVAVGVRST